MKKVVEKETDCIANRIRKMIKNCARVLNHTGIYCGINNNNSSCKKEWKKM